MTSPRSLAQRALPLLVLVGSLLVATVLVARGPRHANDAHTTPVPVQQLPAE